MLSMVSIRLAVALYQALYLRPEVLRGAHQLELFAFASVELPVKGVEGPTDPELHGADVCVCVYIDVYIYISLSLSLPISDICLLYLFYVVFIICLLTNIVLGRVPIFELHRLCIY